MYVHIYNGRYICDVIELLLKLLLLLLCYGNIIKNDVAFLKLLLVDFGASD